MTFVAAVERSYKNCLRRAVNAPNFMPTGSLRTADTAAKHTELHHRRAKRRRFAQVGRVRSSVVNLRESHQPTWQTVLAEDHGIWPDCD